MADKQLKVMVSSTSFDLPEHRKEILEACQRQGMFALRMEDLPANSDQAAGASLKMVDQADIFIGILGSRYGYVPKTNNPDQISVTEMEYNRAVERGTERMMFVMADSHPLTEKDVEIENSDKRKAFKERVLKKNIVRFFNSPVELRAEAINSLSKLRQPDPEKFHYISDIPVPPEKYVAHSYTLSQSYGLMGRQQETDLLTDWVAKPGTDVYNAHVFSVVAIGGMGKSALTWKWFNTIAPKQMTPIAGRIWWSFYESDATFENFVIRALAYATKRKLEEIQQIPSAERETQLLAVLNREHFLIVLDGLERLLIAYARGDAAHMENIHVGDHSHLRKTADPRIGQFLTKLTQIKNSRVLISTRLQPFELEEISGSLLRGCFRWDLKGLTDEDALELWNSFEIQGSRDLLLPVFNTFGKHPLLIQLLAGEVKKYRRAPGDFKKWREANPRFDPASLPHLQGAMSQVLGYALQTLDNKTLEVLRIVAAFRMPAQYDALVALLVGEKNNQCKNEQELDEILTELEDRGLVGWDKVANRYDLHPIVRGGVWHGLADNAQRVVYSSLYEYFQAIPEVKFEDINSLEDLTPAIELYNTLIGLERYDDAAEVFRNRLDEGTHFRLSASRQRVELLEMLFPDGMDRLPRVSTPDLQAFILKVLAVAYRFSGQPGRSVCLMRRFNALRSEMDLDREPGIGLGGLSVSLRFIGKLYESKEAVMRGLAISRNGSDLFLETVNLYWLGLTLGMLGVEDESESALQRSLRLCTTPKIKQNECVINSHLAQRAIWFRKFADALTFAELAWKLADIRKFKRDYIGSARVWGEAALGLDHFEVARERLHHALTGARDVGHIEEELPILIALAELTRRQVNENTARDILADVWEYAERGPYPLFHADALNVLAQIERDAGNTDKAIEAATKAYQLAWCDGPPYAYHWGLIKAQKHLKELGAPLPDMPPFDESKYEPMPEVEINPKDEFHPGTNKQEPDPTSKNAQKKRRKRKKK